MKPSTNRPTEENKIMCLPYVTGVFERLERVSQSIKSAKTKSVFKPMKTFRMQVVLRVTESQKTRRKVWSKKCPARTVIVRM